MNIFCSAEKLAIKKHPVNVSLVSNIYGAVQLEKIEFAYSFFMDCTLDVDGHSKHRLEALTRMSPVHPAPIKFVLTFREWSVGSGTSFDEKYIFPNLF